MVGSKGEGSSSVTSKFSRRSARVVRNRNGRAFDPRSATFILKVSACHARRKPVPAPVLALSLDFERGHARGPSGYPSRNVSPEIIRSKRERTATRPSFLFRLFSGKVFQRRGEFFPTTIVRRSFGRSFRRRFRARQRNCDKAVASFSYGSYASRTTFELHASRLSRFELC